jgi:hypothetical protein
MVITTLESDGLLSTGGSNMKAYRQFKPFQIRWREELCQNGKPYLYRWTFIFFGYSIRLHHWISSDVGPHLHDHANDFISILFKGSYTNITANGSRFIKAPFIWGSRAETKHRLEISPEGAWTILLCGKPYRKWGFWVNGVKWRPLRYFHKFHHS